MAAAPSATPPTAAAGAGCRVRAMRFGHAMRSEWGLDPAVLYLNHGTVGAPPLRVLAEQQRIRDAIERQPALYLLRDLAAVSSGRGTVDRPRLRTAAEAVARRLGARGEDLVFVGNATEGCNAVFRSLRFAPGDEIVVTDHAYGAVATAARYAAGRAGATVRAVALPVVVRDPAAVTAAVAAALGPRTRLLVVDHVTSDSALILPVAAITALAREAGVPVLVDGAHAPGAIPLDIPALGADWYAANLHKWAWSPRSAGILWAAPARQEGLHPPVISWGHGDGFTAEFDWTGTRDPSPWLAAPAGFALMEEWGVEAIRDWNHRLAWEGARRLAARWGVEFATPESMIGVMASVPLPGAGGTPEDAKRLRDALLFDERIEIPVHAAHGRLSMRVSAQVYVEPADLDRLAAAVLARLPLATPGS